MVSGAKSGGEFLNKISGETHQSYQSSLKGWAFFKTGEGLKIVNKTLRWESKLERKCPHGRSTFVNQHYQINN